MLCSAEADKKCKYMEACLTHYASFTPLCFSTDGMFGIEVYYFHYLDEWLSTKWERSYSEIIGLVRSRLLFAIRWATILCVGFTIEMEIFGYCGWCIYTVFLNLTDILNVVTAYYFNCMFCTLYFCVTV